MKRALVIFVVIAAITAIAWWLGVFSSETPDRAQPDSTAPFKRSSEPAKKSAKGESPPPADEPSHLGDALNSPTGDIRSDLRIVSDLLEAFRTNFPRDGNPVGDNAEITAALTGKNPLGLQLISPKHAAINKNGELCDRWGTPFFFHAESAHRMEVRSAGPDRKMWNDDDVVFTP